MRAQALRVLLSPAVAMAMFLPLTAPAARVTQAAAASLSASGTVAPNLTLAAAVRPGPYFAGEALSVQITIRNLGRQTVTLQQANACRFSAQVLVIGRAVTAPTLPPGPLCTGVPSTVTLLPGVRVSGTVSAVVPALAGPARKTYRISLLANALLRVPGASASAHFSLRSGVVYVPFLAPRVASGAAPNQTLRLQVSRDGQGFVLRVTDGRNKAVTGVSGWYVVHAPDGDLAWGTAGAGRIYCGAGCQTGSQHGTYRLSVVLVRDGYSMATATLTYKA
jgi:hypothetical protein